VELSKGLLKIAIVGYVTYLTIKSETPVFVGYMDMEVAQILGLSADMILALGFRITLLLLIMAVLDFAFQRWDHNKNLRMTRQEVKEELKQQEGDPVMRSRIRSLQRDMSRRRMMGEVEEADVVVTNPTHVAVALKYKPEQMSAPLVVAKGQRLIAAKIKELARQAGVPVVENKPLARAVQGCADRRRDSRGPVQGDGRSAGFRFSAASAIHRLPSRGGRLTDDHQASRTAPPIPGSPVAGPGSPVAGPNG